MPRRRRYRKGVVLNTVKRSIRFSLRLWDISLTLNMTYFSLYVILNAVKNPTEELMSIYFITLVVGYFADAQYDVKKTCGIFRLRLI